MDLPTYTNIWRIEKRLYKLYDLRLPMPLPLVQIGVFLGVFVPWIVLLRIVGIPFESPWHVLYIVPPGVLTWLATRPVIEGKRLTELLLSQGRYLSEPRTWCRLTPIREPREVVIVARVWRRAEAPAPVAAPERAAIKSRRKRRAAAEPTPVLLATPSTSPAPPPLVEYAAQRDVQDSEAPAPPPAPPAPAAQAPAAPLKPWRRTTRDISHEDDVQPIPAALEHPPATPRLEAPPPAPGSGKRAFASGIRRPGAPAEFWQATPPAAPQQPQADVHRAAAETANATPAPRPPEGVEQQRARAAGSGAEPATPARERGSEGGATPVPRPSGGEPGDKKVAGAKRSAPQPEPGRAVPPAAAQGPGGDQGARETRRDPPRPWTPPQRATGRPPAPRPEAPGPTRPDIPMVPGAFGTPPSEAAAPPPPEPQRPEPQRSEMRPSEPRRPEMRPSERPAEARPSETPPEARPSEPSEPPRLEPPRPWSEGLSKPRPASAYAPTWPPTPEAGPAPEAGPVQAAGPAQVAGPARQAGPGPESEAAPVEQSPPVEEEAPPREVRSQPASPVRPRPLPPPPAPPPSGPAITPPDPGHEVSGGGLRRLFHAVGGGHGDVDADYQQRLQQPFHGTRHVVVLGCTGGAGQTVTALMLGHTFAQHNGEPVVAIDVNPGPGALARRTRSDTNETLTGLITRADQVGSLTAMRRYTSQAKSGLDVIAAGKNPLQALDDRDYALAIRTIDRFYSVTMLDAAAAVVARVLPYADQIVLVAPASADAPRAVAMTFEWLDGHGYEELRSRAVTVINGVSRRSMDDVEQAEAVARGRCRALVRIPWDDHLSMDRAPRNELKSLRTPTRRAYLALAGVVAGGFTVMPERYQELQQEQEATR